MVLVGLGFLLQWLLVQVFTVEIVKAVLITAIVFIVLGLLVGERPFIKQQP